MIGLNTNNSTVHKVCVLFTVLFVFVSRIQYATAAEEEEAVVALTTETFDKFITENKMALVEFYAPWCGHCKNLAPEYEAAAKVMKSNKVAIPFAKIDATAETELAQKFDVKGYPTLKFFKNKEALDYTGGRTKTTIIQWLESMTGSAVEVVDTEADADKVSKDTVTFVAIVNKDKYTVFEQVAEKNRMSGKFVAVIKDDAKNVVSVYQPKEESKTTDVTDSAALDKWIQIEKFPLFGPIDGDNYAAYAGKKEEIVWFAGTAKDFGDAGKAIREVAAKLRSKYSFVWLDTEKFGSHAESALGIVDYPGLVLRVESGGRFVYGSTKFDTSAPIVQFFDDIASGKIEKSLKSEPIPEKNDAPVKIVVGKTFDEIVFQKDKDVLLEIYAPWCGHCKQLEPIYLDLAEQLASVDSLVIAKMDGTANESAHEEFQIQGFPSIFWVKAGAKTPKTYSEGRTLEDLYAFIKKESSKPIEVALKVEEEKKEEDKDEL